MIRTRGICVNDGANKLVKKCERKKARKERAFSQSVSHSVCGQAAPVQRRQARVMSIAGWYNAVCTSALPSTI